MDDNRAQQSELGDKLLYSSFEQLMLFLLVEVNTGVLRGSESCFTGRNLSPSSVSLCFKATCFAGVLTQEQEIRADTEMPKFLQDLKPCHRSCIY